MDKHFYIPLQEIRRIRQEAKDPIVQASLLGWAFRINTLYMIARAGSGHLGSSFSCADIITWLWTQEMKNPNRPKDQESDLYFSSKGHDAPGLYSLMLGLERLDFNLIHQLRRIGGLPGHPDLATIPDIITNTGSLGMGISKAKGMALANRLQGKKGRIYVLTGDGELQEGQIWESLQPTANRKLNEITVIVDHNKMQSDTWVHLVSDLGKLEEKFRSFGWEVARHDGHDFEALRKTFAHFKTITDRPQILIADTIKGKGVSFMESTAQGEDESLLYKFHSGAPSHGNYESALEELKSKLDAGLGKAGLKSVSLEGMDFPVRFVPKDPQKLVAAYGDELLKIGGERKDVVALDGDLMLDTGLIPFKDKYPERFFECGIAEMDMVSTAGGFALNGMLPIVHSFACFLSTRPNEQIYNNATEHTKVIYAGSLAGIVPGTPGHSHQSVRDISLLGSIPGMFVVQPSNEAETRLALRWAVEENTASTYIRLVTPPQEISYTLPAGYRMKQGWGITLKPGAKAALIAYGPTTLQQAYLAGKLLADKGIDIAVINLPWLNRISEEWIKMDLKPFLHVFTVDDHMVELGQGIQIAALIAKLGTGQKVTHFGIETVPHTGQNPEVVKAHKLDAESLVGRISAVLG
jgi:transketolase